jgi:hypothetical protein
MHEAQQHRQFIKRLHTLIHSPVTEDQRAEMAKTAVLSYAAALDETAGGSPQGADAYIELHLTKAQNWVMAWRSLSDPIDPATARVCEAAGQALDDEKDRLHARAA